MLITIELLFCTDLRRSLFTLGSMTVEQKPALESAISDYAGLYATTPPGVWVRSYKGRNWLTQSVPALPFFAFLALYRLPMADGIRNRPPAPIAFFTGNHRV
ncbi:hypothetical protein MXY24_000157 [Salmonella enterica]|nr:hypothetical protein [Salmonella enterica]EJC0219798.1 hypothetical protein [Salmonella enterica]EJC0229201.1 hypothetical protein [Salmonella enterica]EJC0365398.1 hypothetical protein [Salmonella enterica]EJC0370227.1 hypothetical protein [Salmonella enterica]